MCKILSYLWFLVAPRLKPSGNKRYMMGISTRLSVFFLFLLSFVFYIVVHYALVVGIVDYICRYVRIVHGNYVDRIYQDINEQKMRIWYSRLDLNIVTGSVP